MSTLFGSNKVQYLMTQLKITFPITNDSTLPWLHQLPNEVGLQIWPKFYINVPT